MKGRIVFLVAAVVCMLAANVFGGYYDRYFDLPADGDGWTDVSGVWTLDTNGGTYSSASTGAKISAYQGGLAYGIPLESLGDYTVNATFAIGSGTDSGVIARFKDAGDFYHLRYHGTLGLQIYRWVGGVAAKLAEVPVTATLPLTLSFTVEGDQLSGSLYVDGVELAAVSCQDSSHAGGTFGFRAWSGACVVDEVHVSSGAGAIPISPFNNEVGVSTSPVMRWASAEDLHGNVIAGADKYYLYISGGSANDPNVFFVDEIDPEGDEGTYDQLQLGMDRTYYWTVEQAFADTAGPGDPNNIMAGLWRFDTIKSIPVIRQQPRDIFVKEGQTASMSVTVATLSPETYQWYRVVEGGAAELLDGETGETLVFDPVTSEDVGSYYCVVENQAGAAPPSEIADVILKVVSAHWTMDRADYVNGRYLDLEGGHDAVTNAPGVTFIEGMDGTPNGAVVIDPNSWANAGTWAPSAQTGQFSISLWMKWNGITSSNSRPIAKRDIDWPTAAWYVLINPNTANIEFESYSYMTGPMGVLSTDTQQWQFVCVTFDGASAVMYVDGELASTASVGLTDAPESPLIIGAGNSAGGLAFNGALDDIRIYNYTMSPEDVADVWYLVTEQPVRVNCPDGQFDVDGDCVVDLADFASFAAHWLECGFYPTGCP